MIKQIVFEYVNKKINIDQVPTYYFYYNGNWNVKVT